MEADLATFDPERIATLEEVENERFVAERPRSMALLERGRRRCRAACRWHRMDDLYASRADLRWLEGKGAYFTDVDRHRYLDMYIADASGFCGHAPDPVVGAVSRRIELGNQSCCPARTRSLVAEHLAARYRMPKWQFTSSATQATPR